MTTPLPDDLKTLLTSPDTLKVLATVGPDGEPHAVLDPSIHLDAGGRLVYLELLESSRTQRDLVASLWFDRPVTLMVTGRGRTWRIAARAWKAHVAGPLFRRHYEWIRAERPAADLAAVWLIEPVAVTEETDAVRRARQEAERPFFIHLDRLART